MEKKRIFDDLQSKVSQILESSPAKDIEKNIRAMITQAFSKLDLITREEFELHSVQITQLHEKLDALDKRLSLIESQQSPTEKTTSAN